MTKKRKKPISVADNPMILPYGSNIGAPAIKPDTNIPTWKQKNLSKVNRQLSSKFNELKEEYQKLIEEYRWNELVYNATYNFEPIVGETYHLYAKKTGELFLSIIDPSSWSQDFIASFRLESSQKWIKV